MKAYTVLGLLWRRMVKLVFLDSIELAAYVGIWESSVERSGRKSVRISGRHDWSDRETGITLCCASTTTFWMDFIKAEIESKKRVLTLAGEAEPRKYIKRGEIELERIELNRQTEELARAVKLESQLKKEGKKVENLIAEDRIDSFNVTVEEAIRRLRAKNQPIRLFAESDKERRLRLRALELIEERSTGSRNEFARVMDGVEIGLGYEEIKGESATEKKSKKLIETGPNLVPASMEDGTIKEKKPKDEEVIIDVSLVKTNPHKIYPQIYFALKVSSLLLPSNSITNPYRF